mgnify:CR=1 FL=1|jgi:hypothetical protein
MIAMKHVGANLVAPEIADMEHPLFAIRGTGTVAGTDRVCILYIVQVQKYNKLRLI